MPKQTNPDFFTNFEGTQGVNVKRAKEAKMILDENKLGSNFEENGRMTNCYNFLTIIGISVDAITQKDFSLKQVSTDNEFINNPKILESKDYKETKNEYDKPDDKFPNEEDPFYELDDSRDYNEIKIKNVNELNKSDILVDVVDEILNINLVNNRSVKQFRSLN
jgi:hypothetical protein